MNDVTLDARRDPSHQSRHGRAVSWLLVLAACLVAVPTHAQDEAASPAKTREDTLWAHLKDVRFGPATLDVGGQVRARFEHDDGFTIKGYEPTGHDRLLLERVRLDLSARFRKQRRLFLQLQDAHAFLTRFTDDDFSQSSPIEDTLDIRQAYGEWLHIGGSPFGFRIGRQQIRTVTSGCSAPEAGATRADSPGTRQW